MLNYGYSVDKPNLIESPETNITIWNLKCDKVTFQFGGERKVYSINDIGILNNVVF